jgi:4-diphosphocytidyl-2-C-methyl-D-erythritol kinase
MSRSTLTITSPAKINLWLRLLGKREDGYHEISTRMCPLSLHDEVKISSGTGSETRLTCSDPTLPTDESNLALKALRAFEARTGIKRAWNIHLMKNIPHGAGLGGGSSNAAAVLEGINHLTGHTLQISDLREIATELGSDVPFFITPCVTDATGRGEIVTPVANFPWQFSLVLIKPSFGIPTPWAYQRWADSKELPGVLYAPQLCPWGEMVNDLERPVFEKWIALAALKMWLLDQGETRAALMSGSGSTLFAVTESPAAAGTLAEKARLLCGENTWVEVAQLMPPP